MKKPEPLTPFERERSGVTTVKLSRATRALVAAMQGARHYRSRTVDAVIYDLCVAALDGNGPLGPAERAKIEAPFYLRARDGGAARGSASIPAIASIPAPGRPAAGIPRRPKRPAGK